MSAQHRDSDTCPCDECVAELEEYYTWKEAQPPSVTGTVWLLFTGTEYEDHGVSDVYASEEAALRGAEQWMKNDDLPEYGKWEVQPLFKELSGVRSARHMWFREHDRMWITPYEVKS